MAESKEELKSLLMKVKEEKKSWLKIQCSKNEDHGIQSHHFMANRSGKNANSERLYFWGGSPKITADGDCNLEIKRLCSLEKKL